MTQERQFALYRLRVARTWPRSAFRTATIRAIESFVRSIKGGGK